MDLLFWGFTVRVVGEVLIGLAVLNVHRHVVKEHKIDKEVLDAMRVEKWLAICGITFIIVGYLIELNSNGYVSVFGDI